MPEHSTAPAPGAPVPALVDIGVNLAHDSYDTDREAVIARARQHGVRQLIVTGSTLASTASALALARAHPGSLFATAGVHPHHATDLDVGAIGLLSIAHPQPRRALELAQVDVLSLIHI